MLLVGTVGRVRDRTITRMRARRAAAGLCVDCSTPIERSDGAVRCEKCLERRRARGREYAVEAVAALDIDAPDPPNSRPAERLTDELIRLRTEGFEWVRRRQGRKTRS
jgi:hypothetical protein